MTQPLLKIEEEKYNNSKHLIEEESRKFQNEKMKNVSLL